MTATAADYAWFDTRFPALAEAYCLTLVRDLAPDELLTRLGAQTDGEYTGVEQLFEPSYAAWDEHDGDALFLGAIRLDGWVLAVEPNGYLGVTEAAAVPLSTETRLVAHFRNVNAVDRFHWIEDGDVRLNFEPLFPTRRWGSDPDGVVDVMRQVGFDLSEADDKDDALHTEAAFALAEHLTGVRLTPELLATATYLGGTAPVPRR